MIGVNGFEEGCGPLGVNYVDRRLAMLLSATEARQRLVSRRARDSAATLSVSPWPQATGSLMLLAPNSHFGRMKWRC